MLESHITLNVGIQKKKGRRVVQSNQKRGGGREWGGQS